MLSRQEATPKGRSPAEDSHCVTLYGLSVKRLAEIKEVVSRANAVPIKMGITIARGAVCSAPVATYPDNSVEANIECVEVWTGAGSRIGVSGEFASDVVKVKSPRAPPKGRVKAEVATEPIVERVFSRKRPLRGKHYAKGKAKGGDNSKGPSSSLKYR